MNGQLLLEVAWRSTHVVLGLNLNTRVYENLYKSGSGVLRSSDVHEGYFSPTVQDVYISPMLQKQ
jgi:hypothetical protein